MWENYFITLPLRLLFGLFLSILNICKIVCLEMSNGRVKDSSIDCVFVNIRPSILEKKKKTNLIITFEISS